MKKSIKFASILPSYRRYLEDKIKNGITNKSKLYRELTRIGCTGKYHTIYRYLVSHQKNFAKPKTYTRFETDPGEQAQVDWGSFGKIIINGIPVRLYCFVYVLGYSRMAFIQFTVRQDLRTFQECHKNAFSTLGIPKNILYDNIKTLVLYREKISDSKYKPHFHPDFFEFSRFYGFNIKLCWPHRPQTKGKVESAIKYVRNNFMQGMQFGKNFLTLEELNTLAADWLKSEANIRIHKITSQKPVILWKKERKFLNFPKNFPAYNTSPLIYRHSTQDGYIQYKSNLYSVPPQFTRKKLYLRETTVNGILVLEVFHEDKLIVKHLLSNDRGKMVLFSGFKTREKSRKSEINIKKNKLSRNDSRSKLSNLTPRPLSYYNWLIPS